MIPLLSKGEWSLSLVTYNYRNLTVVINLMDLKLILDSETLCSKARLG